MAGKEQREQVRTDRIHLQQNCARRRIAVGNERELAKRGRHQLPTHMRTRVRVRLLSHLGQGSNERRRARQCPVCHLTFSTDSTNSGKRVGAEFLSYNVLEQFENGRHFGIALQENT